MTEDQGIEKNKLFVWNLSWNVDDEKFKEEFSEFWEIVSAEVKMNKRSWRSKGYGFIAFKNDEDAQTAQEQMNWKEVDGRKVTVSFAKVQRDYSQDWWGYARD